MTSLSSVDLEVILALQFIRGAAPLLMFWAPFCILVPCPGPPWGGCLARWAASAGLGLEKGPCEGSSRREPEPPFLQGGGDSVLQNSLLSLKTIQQINCSCALEFPQHTNLHDVKQLGGNPSMPRTEAELPMSYGD